GAPTSARPTTRGGCGNKTGLIIDEPYTGHGRNRSHRAAPALFGEGIRGKGDVTSLDRDPALVEYGILKGGDGTGGEVGFQRGGARPCRESPKDEQRNEARPPFAAPPEKSAHSMSRGALTPHFPKFWRRHARPELRKTGALATL